MAAVKKLTDKEKALVAILQDDTGISLMEFAFKDPASRDRFTRLRPYQWKWMACTDKDQIAACARDVGKSWSIIGRACSFPLIHPGFDLFISAPAKDHLEPLVNKIEEKLLEIRLLRELLNARQGKSGIKRIPSFEVFFKNGARIVTRLPKITGTGVKGSIDADSVVLTKRGLVFAKDVVVGDFVWTHKNRWKPVVHNIVYENDDVYSIHGGGNSDLRVSGNHRMFIRYTESGKKEKKRLSNNISIEIPCQSDDYDTLNFATPTQFPYEKSDDYLTPDNYWIIGRWVADGHLTWSRKRKKKTSGRIGITVKSSKKDLVVSMFEKCGYSPWIRQKRNSTFDVIVCDTAFAHWLEDNFGTLADGKTIPSWLLFESKENISAFLDGYLSGDGSYSHDKKRWVCSSASRRLAVGIRLLGQRLGYGGSVSWHQPKVTHIDGVKLKNVPKRAWRVTLTEHKKTIYNDDNSFNWTKVRSITKLDFPIMVADIGVADDHSLIVDGLVSHNQHALKVIVDEGQDYPEPGWTEIYPTLRSELPDAQFLVYGVTNGLGDTFDKMADDPDSHYTLHRKIAPEKPSWGEEERKRAINKYGSESSIGYSRNIFGSSFGVPSDNFVIARLNACVRIAESAWATRYNEEVYKKITIEADRLKLYNRKALEVVTLPREHLDKEYVSYWGGFDFGLTTDPSELLIFGLTKNDTYRLLTRITMVEISSPDQVDVINWVLGFYAPRLKRFSMDRTGVGAGCYEEVFKSNNKTVRGHHFSEKITAGWEDRERKPKEKEKDLELQVAIKEYGLQQVRDLVDKGRLELPMDKTLMASWIGTDTDHALDAARMFGASIGLYQIEQIKTARKKKPSQAIFG